MAHSCPTHMKAKFRELMDETMRLCESGPCGDAQEKQMYNKGSQWSFHTHPHGVTKPSGLDLHTHRSKGIPIMCIGVVPQKKTICYLVTKKSYKKVCTF